MTQPHRPLLPQEACSPGTCQTGLKPCRVAPKGPGGSILGWAWGKGTQGAFGQKLPGEISCTGGVSGPRCQLVALTVT